MRGLFSAPSTSELFTSPAYGGPKQNKFLQKVS